MGEVTTSKAAAYSPTFKRLLPGRRRAAGKGKRLPNVSFLQPCVTAAAARERPGSDAPSARRSAANSRAACGWSKSGRGFSSPDR